jgi:hypothetical protein
MRSDHMNEPVEHYRVTLEEVEAIIDEAIKQGSFEYAVLCKRKVVVVEYELRNGYTIPGRSAMIDPKGFNLDEGLRRCRLAAIQKLHSYMGFMRQEELYKAGLL